MQKVIMLVGTLVVAVIGLFLLVALGSLGYGIMNGEKLDRESKEYVDKNIPAIFNSWSVDKLLILADEELIKAAPKEKLVEFFKLYRGNLGKFRKYNGSSGEAKISTKLNLNGIFKMKPVDLTLTAGYDCNVKFAKKDTLIKVKMIKRGEVWKIYHLYIGF